MNTPTNVFEQRLIAVRDVIRHYSAHLEASKHDTLVAITQLVDPWPTVPQPVGALRSGEPSGNCAVDGMFAGEDIATAAMGWAAWCDHRGMTGLPNFLRKVAALATSAPLPSGQRLSDEQSREAVIRAAVAAMPNCNPGVADDLIEGHSMHMEADDLVSVWLAASGAPLPESWIEGAPPAHVEAAWLRVTVFGRDEEGADDEHVRVLLAVRDQVQDGCVWAEAGDWKCESARDSVLDEPHAITHWMPYSVPSDSLAQMTAARQDGNTGETK